MCEYQEWLSCFLAILAAGREPKEAAEMADECMVEIRERYAEESEVNCTTH